MPSFVWQRQPGESPADFTAFACYLRLKGRRSHQAVAERTQLRLGTVRRLSAKFNWPIRVRAFEAALAEATETSLASVVRNQPAAEQAALEDFRRREFELAQGVLHASRAWLDRACDPRRRTLSLTQIVRLIELSSKLGRLATDMPYGQPKRRRLRPEDRPGSWTGRSHEESLALIYGPASAAPPG
jgi:hypothetical protein